MKPLRLLPAFVFLLVASSLSAQLYLRAGLLYSDTGDLTLDGSVEAKEAWEQGVGFNAALGYKFSALRLEGELVYFDTSLESFDEVGVDLDADLTRLSAFANAMIELPGLPFVNPYLGGGIGVTNIDVETNGSFISGGGNPLSLTTSADEMKFSFQAMAGLRFSFAETFSAYLGVRYLAIDDLGFSEATDVITYNADGGELAFELGVALGF